MVSRLLLVASIASEGAVNTRCSRHSEENLLIKKSQAKPQKDWMKRKQGVVDEGRWMMEFAWAQIEHTSMPELTK